MRLFETIKETVTVEQAAEYYGMKIGRNNMICCPFHNDHYPSMKLCRSGWCAGGNFLVGIL